MPGTLSQILKLIRIIGGSHSLVPLYFDDFFRECLPAIHELKRLAISAGTSIRSRGPVLQASGKTFDFNTKMPNYETIFFVVVARLFVMISLPLSRRLCLSPSRYFFLSLTVPMMLIVPPRNLCMR